MNDDNTPYIDTISARDLVHLLYQGGLIELPYLEGDVVNITSCPVHNDYRLRDDLTPVGRIMSLSLRSEIGVTDYDEPDALPNDPAVLHPRSTRTSRIVIDLGDE